jgi:putative endonuclease
LKFSIVVSIRLSLSLKATQPPLVIESVWFRLLALNHRLKQRFSMAWMYILQCSDGSYYVGSTKNLDLRLSQHQSGKGSRYTSGRLPVQLVYCEEYERVSDAFYREQQVQGWTRRKREALINGNPELLPALAKKVFDKSRIRDNSVVE